MSQVLSELGPARSGGIADDAAQVLSALGDRARARALLVTYLTQEARDTHAGQHLKALLTLDRGIYDDLSRCAYSVVPRDDRVADTPDPGDPTASLDCEGLLRSAAG